MAVKSEFLSLLNSTSPNIPSVGLIASLISKWPANEHYRYGFGRAQVIGGFVNGLFLIFVALFIVTEGLERFMEPPEVDTNMLMEVSIGGLLVNILGIFAFSHAHTHGGVPCTHSHSEPKFDERDHGARRGHGHGHGARRPPPGKPVDSAAIQMPNTSTANAVKGESRSLVLDGVLLHVIADTLGSVSVIVSSLLIHAYGWMIADPICSLFTSALILISVYPLLRDSGGVLMQRTPTKLEPFLTGSFQKISAINGVVEYREPRFWTMSGNDWYGTMILLVRPDADGYAIRQAASNVLAEVGVEKMVIQVDQF